ncbi:hypothetical protein [Caulobacter sp. UNC358MFTsu5.1]|uniref:hypothetical protein n=1 Tax=Caulobacter sp. UNC358MFTsu5.1 TaxID=1449049 RepID=UPI0004A6AE41|nr:hypothetical protein [Caulobacter sp. UNC358MFTsu5.1]
MTDTAEPIAKPYRVHMVAAVIVAGLLWLADGRLWPSVADRLGGFFWLFLLLQLVPNAWLSKSRLGRVVAVLLYGAFFWIVGEGLSARAAESSGARNLFLLGGGCILAVIAANAIWDREPRAWRARMAASRITYGVGSCVLLVLGGGLIWTLIGALDPGAGASARAGLTALFLAMGGGLALALWRLEGWARTFACWTVVSLAWIGIMTGLAAGAAPSGIDLGGWLFALLPPLIVGAVLLAYYRINRAYRV